MTKGLNDQFGRDITGVDVSNAVVQVVTASAWDGYTTFRVYLTFQIGAELEDVECDNTNQEEYIKVVRQIQNKYNENIPFLVSDFDTEITTRLREIGGINVISMEEYEAPRARDRLIKMLTYGKI